MEYPTNDYVSIFNEPLNRIHHTIRVFLIISTNELPDDEEPHVPVKRITAAGLRALNDARITRLPARALPFHVYT